MRTMREISGSFEADRRNPAASRTRVVRRTALGVGKPDRFFFLIEPCPFLSRAKRRKPVSNRKRTKNYNAHSSQYSSKSTP